MHILYITELWDGFEDLICKGQNEALGMPSFVIPLKKMIVREGFTVDFAIVVKKSRTLNIGAEWLKNSKYYWVTKKSFIKVFTIIGIIKNNKYDFIYGHGGGGGWGNISALITGKPFGMRYYGTFLAKYLSDSYPRFFGRNLLKSIVYNLPKEFLLMTNDGTKGDLVYNKLCLNTKLYTFHFWLNGIEKSNAGTTDKYFPSLLHSLAINSTTNLLLFPARYDSWKRQHLAVEIMKELHSSCEEKFQLLFCGHKYDQKYYNEIVDLVSSYGLENHIFFRGPIPQLDLSKLMANSFGVFSLYDFSNLGNVMIEASIAGAFIITIQDGSTDCLIENDITGIALPFDESYVKNVSNKLIHYYKNSESVTEIKNNVRLRADALFLSWDQRSQNEIILLKESAT